MTWVFVAEITDALILGLDVVHIQDVSVDLRRHMLILDDEEVPLQRLCGEGGSNAFNPPV
jgi:hypothetical protein